MSITAARGFVAGGLACGIKDSGAPDLALVATDDRAAVMQTVERWRRGMRNAA